MPRNYLAFDIETAKVLPARVDDLLAHRPLGIACAATLTASDAQPEHWHGRTEGDQPAARMTKDESVELVEYLARMVDEEFTILTWNGLGFDL